MERGAEPDGEAQVMNIAYKINSRDMAQAMDDIVLLQVGSELVTQTAAGLIKSHPVNTCRTILIPDEEAICPQSVRYRFEVRVVWRTVDREIASFF